MMVFSIQINDGNVNDAAKFRRECCDMGSILAALHSYL